MSALKRSGDVSEITYPNFHRCREANISLLCLWGFVSVVSVSARKGFESWILFIGAWVLFSPRVIVGSSLGKRKVASVRVCLDIPTWQERI